MNHKVNYSNIGCLKLLHSEWPIMWVPIMLIHALTFWGQWVWCSFKHFGFEEDQCNMFFLFTLLWRIKIISSVNIVICFAIHLSLPSFLIQIAFCKNGNVHFWRFFVQIADLYPQLVQFVLLFIGFSSIERRSFNILWCSSFWSYRSGMGDYISWVFNYLWYFRNG